MFELAPEQEKHEPCAKIKVIGVGGAGGNAVNSMIEAGAYGIEFMVANTDAQALAQSKSSSKIQLGVKLTKGLGSGAHPDVGRRAAEEDIEQILHEVGDTDIVFLTAGMGGGTGSGALPVIARALKERGILSIAIVTRPFFFEGKYRARIAQDAIDLLSKEIDTLVVVSNQKLLETVDRSVSMIDAFGIINGVLYQSVKSIADIIINPGHINVDFADLRAIMKDMGMAVMGSGRASGTERAAEAALQAIASPLLENMSIEGAHGVLLNITGGIDLGLHEIHEAAALIQDQAAEDANIIIGSVIDQNLTDEIIITVIATGFDQEKTVVGAAEDIHVTPTVKETQVVAHEPIDGPEAVAQPSVCELQQQPSVDQPSADQSMTDQPVMSKEAAQSHVPEKVAEAPAAQRFDIQAHPDMLDNLDVPAFMRKEAESRISED